MENKLKGAIKIFQSHLLTFEQEGTEGKVSEIGMALTVCLLCYLGQTTLRLRRLSSTRHWLHLPHRISKRSERNNMQSS